MSCPFNAGHDSIWVYGENVLFQSIDAESILSEVQDSIKVHDSTHYNIWYIGFRRDQFQALYSFFPFQTSDVTVTVSIAQQKRIV